ncbi:MAG: redoxin domain-containing protein [Candidatus Sumerlaeota bacterium]|nr:redoxin domain-containing protein [Candidatus Sumerlaeota bacterium]
MRPNSAPRRLGLGRALLLMAGFVLADAPIPSWAHLEPGVKAPDFQLPSLDYRPPLSLSRESGDRLLVFLRADQAYTSPVLQMCNRLSLRLPRLPKRCLPILIWVGALPRELAEQSAGELGPVWRVAHDPEGETARAYQMLVSPTIYLIDAQGVIVRVFPAWNPLLEARLLEALGAGPEIEPLASSPTLAEGMSPRERASLYFSMGRAMAAQGLWEEALGDYERGLALSPKTPEALAEAARAAWVISDRDKARSLALRSLELDPNQPLAQAVVSNVQGRPVSLFTAAETTNTLPVAPPSSAPRAAGSSESRPGRR